MAKKGYTIKICLLVEGSILPGRVLREYNIVASNIQEADREAKGLLHSDDETYYISEKEYLERL